MRRPNSEMKRLKVQAIELFDKGMNGREVSVKLKVSLKPIYKWLNEWKKKKENNNEYEMQKKKCIELFRKNETPISTQSSLKSIGYEVPYQLIYRWYRKWKKHEQIKKDGECYLNSCSNKITITKPTSNELKITCNSEVIKTLDDLIRECNIDLKVWQIDRWSPNAWGVTSFKTGKPLYSTNYQVKAWLSKINPDTQNFPIIKPLNINIKQSKSSKNKQSHQQTTKKALILADSHNGYIRDMYSGKLTPFHDRRVWNIALQLAEREQPEVIALLGDMMDLAEYTDKFLKSPEVYWTIQPTLIELGYYLTQLRKLCPDSRIVYLEGNHEARIKKFIINHYISGFDLKPIDQLNNASIMSPEFLLNLKNLNIEYKDDYPNNAIWLKNIEIGHGNVIRASGKTCSAILSTATWPKIIGHIHRTEYISKTIHKKHGHTEVISVFSPGTMSHIDGRVPCNNKKVNWQQGIGMVDYYEHISNYSITPIEIRDGVTIYNGNMIIGKDNIDKIVKSIDWEHKHIFLM